MGATKEDWERIVADAKYELIKKRDYLSAYKKFKYLADHNVYEGVFWCALYFEKGWLGGYIDLDRAQYYFEKMRNEWDLADGSLGCVRIILAKKDISNRGKAVDYCMESMEGITEPLAYLLLGRIYEELKNPPAYKKAREMYREAAYKGSYIAIKMYVKSLWRSGNRTKSILVHVLSVILYPYYRVRFGRNMWTS